MKPSEKDHARLDAAVHGSDRAGHAGHGRRIPDNISPESARAAWEVGLMAFPVQPEANVACWYGEKGRQKLRQAYTKLTIRCVPGFGRGDIIGHPELLANEMRQFLRQSADSAAPSGAMARRGSAARTFSVRLRPVRSAPASV